MNITECTYNDYNKLAHAITQFNIEHITPGSAGSMKPLGYVIKSTPWGVAGGITARLLLGNCLSIEILWVEPEHRHKGYATRLLNHLEESARNLGSHLSQVDTFDFQALEFYQKNGYEIFGVLDDCPCSGNKRYYLKKAL